MFYTLFYSFYVLPFLSRLKALTLLIYDLFIFCYHFCSLPPFLLVPWQCLQVGKKEFWNQKMHWGGGGSVFYSVDSWYSVPEYTPSIWSPQLEKHWRMTFLLSLFIFQETHEIVAIKKFKDSEGIYVAGFFPSVLSFCKESMKEVGFSWLGPIYFWKFKVTVSESEYSLSIMICFGTFISSYVFYDKINIGNLVLNGR